MTATLTLAFDPPIVHYSTKADEVLTFDMTTPLAKLGGTQVASPTVELMDLRTGDAITTATPGISGANLVTLRLDGSTLRRNRRYQLVVGFTADPTTNAAAFSAIVQVDF